MLQHEQYKGLTNPPAGNGRCTASCGQMFPGGSAAGDCSWLHHHSHAGFISGMLIDAMYSAAITLIHDMLLDICGWGLTMIIVGENHYVVVMILPNNKPQGKSIHGH